MTQRSDNTQELDEILNNYGLKVHEFKLYEPSAEWDGERLKAKQAILQWVADEVVGKHETNPYIPFGADILTTRDNLREEQRAFLRQHGWKGNSDGR